MRLALNSLACTTSTGRRAPGPEPVGSGSEAHHTSPRYTTTPHAAAKAPGVASAPDRAGCFHGSEYDGGYTQGQYSTPLSIVRIAWETPYASGMSRVLCVYLHQH